MGAVTRNLWRYKKLYSFAYPQTATAAAFSPIPVPVELTKYAQEDVFNRIVIHVIGTITVANPAGGANLGTATGWDNPEGLLTQLTLSTTPQVTGITPVNRLSARGLLYENMIERGYLIKATPITDVAGNKTVDYKYVLNFKRKCRKGIEFDFAIEKYTSALLNMTFGGREQLFTGGGQLWNFAGVTVEIYADSNFGLDPNKVSIHAHELFENTYPILATQSDFPIDTLPSGYLYTDMIFLTELDNVLANVDSNGVPLVTNFDIEGGGRVWLSSGDANADIVQIDWTQDLLETGQTLTGIFVPVSLLREKMYTRMIDALLAPITLKLSVQAPVPTHVNNVRLIGRRMIPDAVHNKGKVASRKTA